MQFKKSIVLSMVTSALLIVSGCSSDGSSDSVDGGGSSGGSATAKQVLGGTVDLGVNTAASSSLRAVDATCGEGGDVQIYAIEDTDYVTPLLSVAVSIDPTSCEFEVDDSDFVNPALAGSDKQYLIRTIVKKDGEKIELSAAKLSDGLEVGTVDPIATMVKERFTVAIKEVKETMEKLSSLGVTGSAITDAINSIVVDFEKNLADTVADLKEDIASGKLEVGLEVFVTTETFDTSAEDAAAEREAKLDIIVKKLADSSAADTFEVLDSSVKKQQLDRVVITDDTLRQGINAGLADIKFGIIESFVKIGLPVHDGNGNLIVYMPIEPSRVGELPGRMYQLTYTDNGTTATVGNDFAIRVINPETDLSRVNGDEDWFREYLQNGDTIIPSAVIDAMIVGKDHTITMQELGKVLNGIIKGDNTVDAFAATSMYSTVMSDSVQTSVQNIVSAFKKDFIKHSFEQLMWESTDRVFTQLNGDFNSSQVIDNILNMPFIAQEGESPESFESRLGANSEAIKYIVENVGASLANGIPVSDSDATLLQFKTGSTITAESKMKPLAALAMINLFMEAKGGGEALVFEQTSLQDMFGWLVDESTDSATKAKFDAAKIWLLSYDNSAAVPTQTDGTVAQEAQDSKEIVLTLMAAISGKSDIQVERSFEDMLKNFSASMDVINRKNAEAFNFEGQFKGDLVEFTGESEVADVSFRLQNFDGEAVVLEAGESLALAPIFVNVETGEWRSVLDKNVTVQSDAQAYSVNSLTVYSPETHFTEEGVIDTDGKFVTNNDFDLLLIKADGSVSPIATFPIFPGTNNLDMPFYYDSSVNYGGLPDVINPDGGAPAGGTFFEHNYLETSGDVFFPQITKKPDASGVSEDVGENIFSYDAGTKTFTKSLDRGVVSDASMRITLLFRNYEDGGESPEVIDTIELSDVVGAGAYLQLELSGPQIETQTINMNILYVGENGEVEYELFKEESFNDSTISGNPLDFIADRFYREGSFTFKGDGVSLSGTVDDLTFNEENGTVSFQGVAYSFVNENFDSITMIDTANNFVEFVFIKDVFTKSGDFTNISGQELTFSDEYLRIQLIFDDNGTVRAREQGQFDPNSHENFLNGTTWSLGMDGNIKFVGVDPTGMAQEAYLVMTKGTELTASDTAVTGIEVIFASVEMNMDGNVSIFPMSPNHYVEYFGTPRSEEDSGFSPLGEFNTDPQEPMLPVEYEDLLMLIDGYMADAPEVNATNLTWTWPGVIAQFSVDAGATGVSADGNLSVDINGTFQAPDTLTITTTLGVLIVSDFTQDGPQKKVAIPTGLEPLDISNMDSGSGTLPPLLEVSSFALLDMSTGGVEFDFTTLDGKSGHRSFSPDGMTHFGLEDGSDGGEASWRLDSNNTAIEIFDPSGGTIMTLSFPDGVINPGDNTGVSTIGKIYVPDQGTAVLTEPMQP